MYTTCVYIHAYMYVHTYSLRIHVWVVLAFRPPTFRTVANSNVWSAAHAVIYSVSSEILKCRLLN